MELLAWHGGQPTRLGQYNHLSDRNRNRSHNKQITIIIIILAKNGTAKFIVIHVATTL